jgi:hypothetical protein
MGESSRNRSGEGQPKVAPVEPGSKLYRLLQLVAQEVARHLAEGNGKNAGVESPCLPSVSFEDIGQGLEHK